MYYYEVMPKKAPYSLPPLKINKKSIGHNLSAIRKERGLTQNELAEKIGITQTLISDYETGRSLINSEMLIRFALTLKVSVDRILGLGDRQVMDSPSLKITRRLQQIDKLPPAKKKSLLDIIDTYLKANE